MKLKRKKTRRGQDIHSHDDTKVPTAWYKSLTLQKWLLALISIGVFITWTNHVNMTVVRPPAPSSWVHEVGYVASQRHSRREKDESKFRVRNPFCEIPNRDPFDSSIRWFLEPPEYISCGPAPPPSSIETVVQNETVNGWPYLHHKLRVDEKQFEDDLPSGALLLCCYSNITRDVTKMLSGYTIYNEGEADKEYIMSPPRCFQKEVILHPEEEFIMVYCTVHQEKKETIEIYKNMHPVVPIKKDIRTKLKRRILSKDEDKLNVLIICYDSMSHHTLLRTMPKTVKYLKRSKFINMRGYNKVGDNTYPNFLALLTGLNVSQTKEKCPPGSRDEWDNCPFIWKDYSQHGYTTAFMWDEVQLNFGPHTYFIKQPTDYYLKPYLLAAQEQLDSKIFQTLHACLGPSSPTDHLFTYQLNFTTAFRQSYHFSLSWSSSFSHYSINQPASMDGRTLQFFKDLQQRSVHNHTAIIFLSDHGMRWGNIRYTNQGWYEDKMPFFYISLPEWFTMKYPKKYQNLLINRNKLTSAYDVYVTLRDILNIGMGITTSAGNVAPGCPTCKSLISEVIPDRGCHDAGIPEEFCMCRKYTALATNSETVQNATKFMVDEINLILKPLEQCAELHVESIMESKYRINEEKSEHATYEVTFETTPGGGLFQVLVQHNNETNNFSSVGMVQRINSFGSQSSCVQDPKLKLYCYCKKQ